MKILIAYYSRTGNNAYLANSLANQLSCDIEKIRPRLNAFLFFLLKMSLGVKRFKHTISDYDAVILVGPIWMGKFVTPLKDFVTKYIGQIQKLYFLTCCGSGYTVKDDKFGHAKVFKVIEEIAGNKLERCMALPIGLVLPEDQQGNGDLIMKTRLEDSNFEGEIQKLFSDFVSKFE